MSGYYEYGYMLGQVQRAYVKAAQQLVAGFNDALRAPSALTPEQIEERRVRSYRAQIARERQLGIKHVAREAARVRRELGLRG